MIVKSYICTQWLPGCLFLRQKVLKVKSGCQLYSFSFSPKICLGLQFYVSIFMDQTLFFFILFLDTLQCLNGALENSEQLTLNVSISCFFFFFGCPHIEK